jgi:acyl carrier protein
MKKNRSEIEAYIKKLLVELFELDESDLILNAKLYEDLDIDSIDAVEMLIEIKKTTKEDINPEKFSDAKTLGDIIDVVYNL